MPSCSRLSSQCSCCLAACWPLVGSTVTPCVRHLGDQIEEAWFFGPHKCFGGSSRPRRHLLEGRGNALATLGSRTSARILAEASTGQSIKVSSKGVRLSISAGIDVRTVRQFWDPGGYSGWHSHPGPVIFTLKSGTLRIYDEHCHGRALKAGQAFVERPNELMNVRNKSSKRATAYLTVLSPAGALPKEDGPKPTPTCSVP